MKLSIKKLLATVCSKFTETVLLNITGNLSTTTYSLNGTLSDYRFIIVTALSAYRNRWSTTLAVSEFSSTSDNHFLSLGTEYAVYMLAISYVSDTSIKVASKGSGTTGVSIIGIP